MDGSDGPAVQSPAMTFAVIWSTICWYIGRGSLAERKSSGFTVTVLVDYAQYAQLSGRGKSLATGLLGPSPLPPQRLVCVGSVLPRISTSRDSHGERS